MTQRVAITGLGVITPIGSGKLEFWDALIAGTSGIAPVTSFDTSGFPVHLGAEVRDFDPERYLRKRSPAEMGRGSQLAVAAAHIAVLDSGVEID